MATRTKTREKIATIQDEATRERLLAMLDLADSLQSGKTQEAKDIEKMVKTIQDDALKAGLLERLSQIGETGEKSEAEILEDLKLVGVTLSEVCYHGLGKIATAETDRIVVAPKRAEEKKKNGNGGNGGESEE